MIKTSLSKNWEDHYQMGEEQLSRTMGLAKHIGEQLERKLRSAYEPEGLVTVLPREHFMGIWKVLVEVIGWRLMKGMYEGINKWEML